MEERTPDLFKAITRHVLEGFRKETKNLTQETHWEEIQAGVPTTRAGRLAFSVSAK
jgi:hypothetical protein